MLEKLDSLISSSTDDENAHHWDIADRRSDLCSAYLILSGDFEGMFVESMQKISEMEAEESMSLQTKNSISGLV
jgi:hypothetical protein